MSIDMEAQQHVKRELPVIEIGGTDFTVHLDQLGFREVNNPESFFTIYDMLTLEDHHEFLFDKTMKRPVEEDWMATADDQRYEYIWIKRIESLDPAGMKEQQSWLKYEAMLQSLPVVDIERSPFYWNRAASRFIEVANPWNIIYKNDIQSRDGRKGFYYDLDKKVCPFDYDLEKCRKRQYPSNIKFIDVDELLKRNSLQQGNSPQQIKIK